MRGVSASEATGGRDISDSSALLEAERLGAPFLVSSHGTYARSGKRAPDHAFISEFAG